MLPNPADARGEETGAFVAILEETTPTKPEALRALRQSRLRAAAAFLCAWLLLIVAQAAIAGVPRGLAAAVAALLAAAVAALSLIRGVSAAGLRVVELLAFAAPAAVFVLFQVGHMRNAAGGDAPMELDLAVKNALISSGTLLLAYALLIPNRVRSAAPLVVGLAAFPLLTKWAVMFADADVRTLMSRHETLEPASLNAAMAAVLGGLALYGIRVLQVVREEAFEGRRLNQYQLGRKLGEGGMGVVYAAEHRLLKRQCALKMIRPRQAADRRAVGRLEREVRLTAELSHPNVVEIYDYGRTDDGAFYYVMERLRGASLRGLVRRAGPLPAGRIVYLLRQVCDGLAEAHAAGLTHRDLTPANIYAARAGRRCDVAKVLDFGLARRIDSGLGGRGQVSGTPDYMAPEQAAGSATIDGRADLYALGAVAYFLATGRPPFAGRGVADTLSAHAREPVVPPSERAEVPPDLERVILRCLEKAPRDRFQDADEAAAALGGCDAAGEWGPAEAAAWWSRFDPSGPAPGSE